MTSERLFSSFIHPQKLLYPPKQISGYALVSFINLVVCLCCLLLCSYFSLFVYLFVYAATCQIKVYKKTINEENLENHAV